MLATLRRWAIRSLVAGLHRESTTFGLVPYRGPGRTLFVFDGATRRWLVVTWDGSEVSLPAEDLEGFLVHLLDPPRRPPRGRRGDG